MTGNIFIWMTRHVALLVLTLTACREQPVGSDAAASANPDANGQLDATLTDADFEFDATEPDAAARDAATDTTDTTDTTITTDASPTDASVDPEGLSILFDGEGELILWIDSVSGGHSARCTDNCTVSFPAGFEGYLVTVLSTDDTSIFQGFEGACAAADSPIECPLAEDANELVVHFNPTGTPAHQTHRWSGEGSDYIRDVAVDSAGNRHILARLEGARVGDASRRGWVLFSLDPAGMLRFVVDTLGWNDLAVAQDGSVWAVGGCTGSERFDGTSIGTAGPCLNHFDTNGQLIDWQGWPGGGAFRSVDVGPDNSVAVVAVVNEATTWTGVDLRADRTAVGRLLPNTTSWGFVAEVARHGADLETRVAVGPDHTIYVLGSVRGPTRVAGALDIDIANFARGAYVARYDQSGTLLNTRSITSVDGAATEVVDIVVDESAVYVGGSYNGLLDIGNTTAVEARGVSAYPFVASLDPNLSYQWHRIATLWADITSLAPRPDGGVFVTTDAANKYFAWQLGESGWLALPDHDGQHASALNRMGQVEWMTNVCQRCDMRVESNGEWAMLAGSYRGSVVLGSTPFARGLDALLIELHD